MGGYDCLTDAHVLCVGEQVICKVDMDDYRTPPGSGSNADGISAANQIRANADAVLLAHGRNMLPKLVAALEYTEVQIGLDPKHADLPVGIRTAYSRIIAVLDEANNPTIHK